MGATQRSIFGSKPSGLWRTLANLPVWVYRLRFGWLLDHRFLMLTHRGRKSGRIYRTVVEVVHHDPATRETVVASGWGDRADWYRNLEAAPALEVEVGWDRYKPVQRFLSPDEQYDIIVEYQHRHPFAARLLGVLGLNLTSSEEQRRASIASLKLVAFQPVTTVSRAVVDD